MLSAFAYLKEHFDVFSCLLEELRILTAQRMLVIYDYFSAKWSA